MKEPPTPAPDTPIQRQLRSAANKACRARAWLGLRTLTQDRELAEANACVLIGEAQVLLQRARALLVADPGVRADLLNALPKEPEE